MRDFAWRRWIAWILITTLFALGCVALSQWQFARRAEAVAKIEKVIANYDQPAVPIESALPNRAYVDDLEWRPIEVIGNYLPETMRLVRNRPLNGQPGFVQLVIFKTNSGALITIERGWLATDSNLAVPELVPTPSSQSMTLVGRLRAQEPALNREGESGQLASINVPTYFEAIGFGEPDYPNLYLRLVSEAPTAAAQLTELPKPRMDEGNHLSYALQWILFALMGISALIWGIRQELRIRSGAPGTRRRKTRADRDAEIEDQVLSR